MDIDKIVTDLLDKRLKDCLASKVSESVERNGEQLLATFINDTTKKIIIEMEPEIKAAIKKAVEMTILSGQITPGLNWNINFNLPSWELKKQLERAEGKEKKINEYYIR